MMELYVRIILGIAALIALCYGVMMTRFISGILKLKKYVPAVKDQQYPVTVVIAARNEGKNIGACLDSLYQDGLPSSAEVIVVSDHSDDGTVNVVNSLAHKYKDLFLVELGKGKQGKKEAITAGIQLARTGLIVLTDADCIVPKGWLRTISDLYLEHKPDMIIMPVHLHDEPGIFNRLQALEFFSLTAVTAASAVNGFPLMCNGAALAYEKKTFTGLNGFSSHSQVPSGDDMLLLQEVARNGKVMYLPAPEMAVLTPPAPGPRAFFDQRRRWASKTKYYTDKRTVFIAFLVLVMSALPLFMGVSGLFAFPGVFLPAALALFIFKALIDFLCLFLAAKFFNRTRLLIGFLPMQLLYPFYVLLAGLLSLPGSYNWKGRRYSRG
jgi:cellulose synthase/poly-beta-1,6-N-acetylglucosamine synthase-like glycosyltransferase